jgi:hypothetical protein
MGVLTLAKLVKNIYRINPHYKQVLGNEIQAVIQE